MTTNSFPTPSPVVRAVAKLGTDISKARRRRRLTRASLAERSGVSEATLKRLEKGDRRVALESVARALHALGELDRLERLLDSGTDELGLMLMDEQLPKRVRQRKSSGALWTRELLFNLLITNVDDHLWNVGVLYDGNGQWRLAPACDLNPFPDRVLESKTWLLEDTGPITSLEQLIDGCAYFGLQRAAAEREATAMATVLAGWREVATSKAVGLTEAELKDFEPAFEHAEVRAARAGWSALNGVE
jgi:transcriptional regulator with XRE-family HTH domain